MKRYTIKNLSYPQRRALTLFISNGKNTSRDLFGARQHQPSPLEYGHEDFVPPYANTGSTVEEDFCESLMTWVRHRGSIGRYRHSRPGVHRKLKFIATLPNKIEALGLA